MTEPGTQVPRLLIVADLAYAQATARLLDAIEALAPVLADPRVALQLRAKALDADAVASLAEQVKALVPHDATLVLNGHAEIAARLGYAGVHWPEDDLPRHCPPAPPWQSAAVHSLDALRRAEEAGMDAAVFGAVFAPGSHPGEAASIEALRSVAGAARIPVIAIGGITPDRVAECLGAGAHGVGVVSGVIGAPAPAAAARAYLDAIAAAEAQQTESQRTEGVR